MRKGAVLPALLASCLLTLVWAPIASAKEKQIPEQVTYGSGPTEYLERYAGGPATVFIMHELGAHWNEVSSEAEYLQREGNFTVLDVEWPGVKEKYGLRIWGTLTDEIKRAIVAAREHAALWGIDESRFAMVGGSRGANLSLLTSLKANLAEHGTIKAIVSLSGDPNVVAQIQRNREKILKKEEPDKKAVSKISKSYGCQKELADCPVGCPPEPPVCCSGEPPECEPNYVEKWSAYQLVTESEAGAWAPAMFLAASHEEKKTADWEDQQPMAEALLARGGFGEYDIPVSGHGIEYWGAVRAAVLEFLRKHDA
jgi:alpha/beta hydrolase fold